MKLSAEKQGLEMFFKDYQILALQHLWSVYDKGAISREVWENVNLQMKGGISRASIINSLNEMVNDNLLKYEEITGKGGYRRRYYHKYNEKEFKAFMAKYFITKLLEEYPEETKKALIKIS